MEKWILEQKKADFNGIANKFGITPYLARIMINRGVREDEEIRKYLYAKEEDMHNPRTMKDIVKSAEMILEAIKDGEIIAISTDFDNDGLLSGYSLDVAIKRLGGRTRIYAPDRVSEGYGMNRRIVEEAYDVGSRIIVTCDNGIAAFDAIDYAKEKGMKVIVTDHHEVPFEELEDGTRKFLLPNADAIVNPKQKDCKYPFKGLCGAGVAYKLIQILYEESNIPKQELYGLLEYTAIATVADVMDLVDENRIIVKRGLELIKNTSNIGLQALIDVNKLNQDRISAYHIGFVIGPCFNAAGRLETVKVAFDLLQAKTKEEADNMAVELKELNDKRKNMTLKGVEAAIEAVETTGLKNDKVLLVKLSGTHESLAGIIAGRIREKYHKPSFVFVDVEEGIKGSGRSIESYNMFEGLIRCKEYLSRFGGHPMAAGLSLTAENLEPLRRKLNEESTLTEDDFIPKVYIDIPLPFSHVTEQFVTELDLLEPFGKGNSKPLFAGQHFIVHSARVLGKNQNVLKLALVDPQGYPMEALYFGDIPEFNQFVENEYGENEVRNMYQGRNSKVDLAFTYYPSINEYMGRTTVQVIVQNYCRIKK